jgi:calcineurin-like phosphoesterase family protein
MELILGSILGGILGAIPGAILGAIATWFISRHFHKEQIALFNKLPADMRTVILQNPSNVIRPEELLKILEELKSAPVDTRRLTGTIDGGTW